jgi:3',5'-cyclic AMP phosphodiesterase CpdA
VPEPDSQTTPRDTLLHVADLHFWHVTLTPLRFLNKRLLGNFNVWWRRRHQFVMERATPYIDELVAAGPRNVLLTGDFASTSLDEEFVRARAFVEQLRNKEFAIHLMPGNHDVYTFESVRGRRFEQYFSGFYPPDGLPARLTLPGGTPLVLVPTVCPNVVSSRGRITDTEVARVKDLLAVAPEPLIVAGHYPLLDRTAAYEMTPERRLRNAAALRDTLGNCGKRVLYVAGHVHRFSYVADPKYPNLAHLCTGTFFGRNHREGIDGEFVELHVTGSSFSVYRHTHRDAWDRVPAQFGAV